MTLFVVTSRVWQYRQFTVLFVLTALLISSSASFLKAQTNDEGFSSTSFPNPHHTRIGFSIASEGSAQVRDDGPVIVNTDLVTLTVSVTDAAGHSITGLERRAFTILDEKSPQEITFFSDADTPISIAIVFDLSGSMSGEKIRRAGEALQHFMETSLVTDEYSVVAFNEQPQVLLDRTRDSKAVLDTLLVAEPRGSTALFDACYMAVDRLSRAVYPKRVLLLISDGQDNNSHYSLDETRRFLRESDVVLYSIGIADLIQLSGKAGARVRHTLEGLAEITGGKAFYPSNAVKMDEVFEQIALELRHQYSIGYRPQDFMRDGRWHHIKVKVSGSSETVHLRVRTREGYYALRGLGPKRSEQVIRQYN